MRGFSGESKLYEEEDAVGEHRLEALGLHAMDAFRGKIERRREGMDALWPRCLGTLCRGLRN